jgi:hypothetical protein
MIGINLCLVFSMIVAVAEEEKQRKDLLLVVRR